MGKIINIKKAVEQSSKLRNQRKTIVLVGGVFDIIHIGHIKFLEKAKKQGDFLFVLLESDESVKKLKGLTRPLNNQEDRAEVLEAIRYVDYVIKLKGTLKNVDYDKIVKKIGPNVLATTKEDSYIFHKIRQAKLVNAKVKIVLPRLKHISTSKILEEYE